MWHDESPTFPIPKTQFHMTYDSQMIVDQSYLPSSPDPKMLTNQGVLHCQEISKPISAVCMDCWRAKVKCDRQSPCSRCVRKGLECTPQLRRRGRPRAENVFTHTSHVNAEDSEGTQTKIYVSQNGSTTTKEAGRACKPGAVCMGCWRAKVKCDRLSPCSRCVRKGMDCTPHIPVRLRKAQAAAIGASFNHAASLFSAVPKIEPKMISAPAHSASDEDEEAASALLGLFGGISSDAAAPDDAVAQRHQTCKRPRDDEPPIGIITIDFDSEKKRSLKDSQLDRQVQQFEAKRRAPEFTTPRQASLQLQCAS